MVQMWMLLRGKRREFQNWGQGINDVQHIVEADAVARSWYDKEVVRLAVRTETSSSLRGTTARERLMGTSAAGKLIGCFGGMSWFSHNYTAGWLWHFQVVVILWRSRPRQELVLIGVRIRILGCRDDHGTVAGLPFVERRRQGVVTKS